MNVTKTTSIMVVGVGGQGVLTASEIIAQACLQEGFDIKKSEVHGMAQRGGSVVSHVRFLQTGQVAAPLPTTGQVDLLVGFELVETLRALNWLRAGGGAVVNTLLLPPPLAADGSVPSAEDCIARVRQHAGQVVAVDGEEIARQVGNRRTANTAVVGAAAGFLPISEDNWQQAIIEVVPEQTVQVNWQAFQLGRATTVE